MLDEYKNRNVSDAELDALLAEWAEAEVEPPAGFHEQTMKRLRAEAQPKKKNNVVTLFAKNKRWTSIAAAAVLVLFCVPVVQGQLGGDATDQTVNENLAAQQMQVAQNTDAKIDERAVETDKQQNNAVIGQSPAGNADKKTVMSAVVIPEAAQDTEENGIAVAQMPAEDSNLPMAAAFSLEDEEMAVDNSNARMIEQPVTYSYMNDEDSLETLKQKLSDAEEMLLEYQTLLEANPEDTNLQEIVAEQQKLIEELKQKIEEKTQQAE